MLTWQPHQDQDVLCQQGAASRRRTGLLYLDPTQAVDSRDKVSQHSVWTHRADTTVTCRVVQHAHTRVPCPDSRLTIDSSTCMHSMRMRSTLN